MKKIIVTAILIIIMSSNVCIAMVRSAPENIYERVPNEFYIDYHTDKFNDTNFNEPYIVNYTTGKYTFEYLKVYNESSNYTIKFDKYSDANRYYFGILNVFWNDDMFNKYIYNVSIKYNNEVFDYPNSVYHFKSFLIIDPEMNKPLYDLIYNLYVQGIPFKMRIDEMSPLTLIPATHIIDVPSTNFTEAFIYAYSNP